jgi:RNA polymerase sigma-70 factor (ECF subfamily)
VVALTQTIPLLMPSANSETKEVLQTHGINVEIPLLTAALAKGDENAFRKFHELYFDRLFRYHVVIARGDESAAGDALQETFLRVVRNVRRFENEDTFWSWLTVLCRSAAADGGRKRSRYWKLLADYARSLITPAPTNKSSGEIDEKLYDIVAQSLGELDENDRSLVEGKYFRRASMKELSSETGLTERAVESRLLRARRELREKILTKLNYENAS